MKIRERMWLTGEPGRTYRKKRRKLPILKLAVVLLVVIVLYGVLIAPRLVDVTEHEVALAGLPPELDGLRVVQVSDIHCNTFSRAGSVKRIVELANACKPDLVVMTGDFVSYRAGKHLTSGAYELRGLKSRLGVYACLGNHDHWEGQAAVKESLEKASVRVLVNSNSRAAEGLSIAGVDDMMVGAPDLHITRHRMPKTDAVILLSHNPIVLPKVAQKPWLVLSGHSHGGQISLPFLGPRRTAQLPGMRHLARWNESLGIRFRGGRVDAISTDRYTSGWYEEGAARLYVNRGVGTNVGLPLRLNCRPEIACFTLRARE